MGSDPAPIFSNLFLLYYGWQYINNLKKKYIISAQRLCNTFRFINDLITINNKNFEENIQKLKKENHINISANFLI